MLITPLPLMDVLITHFHSLQNVILLFERDDGSALLRVDHPDIQHQQHQREENQVMQPVSHEHSCEREVDQQTGHSEECQQILQDGPIGVDLLLVHHGQVEEVCLVPVLEEQLGYEGDLSVGHSKHYGDAEDDNHLS